MDSEQSKIELEEQEKYNIRFSDGVGFNTRGKLRIERRPDGLYVVGKGMLVPIKTRDEGHQIIQELLN